MSEAVYNISQWRRHFVLVAFALGVLIMVWRAIDLQVVNNEKYQSKGERVHMTVVAMPAHRGMIVDRNEEPVAISTPVHAICATPQQLLVNYERLPELASVLGRQYDEFVVEISKRADRGFMYLKRRGSQELVEKISNMEVPGVYLQREYKRYYPAGEVTSHVVGFTDVDDRGQEGLELAFDNWLQGTNGSKRVMLNRKRSILKEDELIQEARNGGKLVLSIDKRIQYLAYRELKAAVEAHKAKSGSMVVLDALSGEILAMVNQPAFNPNDRSSISDETLRNRVMIDPIEPGSIVKPFVVAAALDTGKYEAGSLVNTTPGQMYVGRSRVQDIRNYGEIDIATVIKKSSNVGVAKLALDMEKEYLWQTYTNLGFGAPSGAEFPGEQTGFVYDFQRWARIDQATIAFGYGVSTNLLQLARSYTVFANQGRLIPVTMLRAEGAPAGEQIFNTSTVKQVLNMMEGAVSDEGTAPRAKVPGYRVAGKTGTVKKADEENGGYTEDKYLSLFAGVLPASSPRLIAVVMIDEPGGEEYYGGAVAAPVFSKVMAGAMRLMDVKPDDLNPGVVDLNKMAHRESAVQAGAL